MFNMLVCNFSLQALSTFEPQFSMRGKIIHLQKKKKTAYYMTVMACSKNQENVLILELKALHPDGLIKNVMIYTRLNS